MVEEYTMRASGGFAVAGVIAAALLLSCNAGTQEGGGNTGSVCQPGVTMTCVCPGAADMQMACRADGSGFDPCPCMPAVINVPIFMPPAGSMAPPPPPPTATAGTTAPLPMPAAGTMSMLPAGNFAPGPAGMGGSPLPAGSGEAGSGMAGSGTAGAGNPADDMDALRQACVDYINMYRATLSLPPLDRATPAQEACSDMGAKKDGDSGSAHSSAGDCDGLGGQNTCPGWPVGGRSGTLEDAMKGCLDQMWAEGPPPLPEDECIAQYQTCFLVHGHWMNMSNDRYSVVSCGFYEMSNGRWWMNQDFGF